jgi:hypothetical protein
LKFDHRSSPDPTWRTATRAQSKHGPMGNTDIGL